jgi:hypothetical protein
MGFVIVCLPVCSIVGLRDGRQIELGHASYKVNIKHTLSPAGGLGKSKEVKDFPEIVLFCQMAGIYHYFTLKDCLLKN